jgi:hypothetical protein
MVSITTNSVLLVATSAPTATADIGSQLVLVDDTVVHDDLQVVAIGDLGEVLQRVAIDQEEIGIGTFLRSVSFTPSNTATSVKTVWFTSDSDIDPPPCGEQPTPTLAAPP